jgi:hypothetical protein
MTDGEKSEAQLTALVENPSEIIVGDGDAQQTLRIYPLTARKFTMVTNLLKTIPELLFLFKDFKAEKITELTDLINSKIDEFLRIFLVLTHPNTGKAIIISAEELESASWLITPNDIIKAIDIVIKDINFEGLLKNVLSLGRIASSPGANTSPSLSNSPAGDLTISPEKSGLEV